MRPWWVLRSSQAATPSRIALYSCPLAVCARTVPGRDFPEAAVTVWVLAATP